MKETRANEKPPAPGNHNVKLALPTININGEDFYVDDEQKKLTSVDHPEKSIRLSTGSSLPNQDHKKN